MQGCDGSLTFGTTKRGSCAVIVWECHTSKKRSASGSWSSQPIVGGMYVGNLLFHAAILFGKNVKKIGLMCQFVNLWCPSYSIFTGRLVSLQCSIEMDLVLLFVLYVNGLCLNVWNSPVIQFSSIPDLYDAEFACQPAEVLCCCIGVGAWVWKPPWHMDQSQIIWNKILFQLFPRSFNRWFGGNPIWICHLWYGCPWWVIQ